MAAYSLQPAKRPANPPILPRSDPFSPFSGRLAQIPREQLEALIEAAIAFLDVMDGDPDLESDDPDTSVEDDPRGFDPEEDLCPPAFAYTGGFA
jgi:hypothetical protein